MPSRRLSSSSSTALASGIHRQDSQQLDVVFHSDPMFVQAGNGKAVPRGLSAVQHDHDAAPVLNFRSDDAYATMNEISRRASAAKEMQAALKAQIAAKRTISTRSADDDDDEVGVPSAYSTARSAYSPAVPRPHSMPMSMPLASDRGRLSPPQLHSVASNCSDALPTAVAARRAIAAQELKNALDAQMQAKMMLEEDDNGCTQLHGDSSVFTDHLGGTTSLMEYSASNLTAWELGNDGASSSFFTESRLPALSENDRANDFVWRNSLRPQGRVSTPPFAAQPASSFGSPDTTARPSSGFSGGIDSFTRRPPRPSTTGTVSTDHTFLRRTETPSPRRMSDHRELTASPSQKAVGSNPNIGAQTQQPLLRFRRDNHFETSQEQEARTERQNRLRAELDAQIAEKQARLEAEQADVANRRSPLVNQAVAKPNATASHHSREISAPLAEPPAPPSRMDSILTDASRIGGGSSAINAWSSMAPVSHFVSPAHSTAGSAQHSARENVAPEDSSSMHGCPSQVLKEAGGSRSPLTSHQLWHDTAPSADLPPATAPRAPPPQATEDGPVHLTPEAQRAKDQELVYRAWQKAHEDAEQEKRRRTRRHQDIAAQAKREREEQEAAELAAEQHAAEQAATEQAAADAAADDQMQKMQVGGTPTRSSGSGTQQQARSTSTVVPTASDEPKVDSKLHTPAPVATDAVKPRRGWLCCMGGA